MTDTLDVLVVGAGPVGLFCAYELTRHGLSCRILDKKTGLSRQSKALGLHSRTLDMFDDCGLLTEILAQGHMVEGVLFKTWNKTLAKLSFEDIEARHNYLIDLPQDKTEHILQQALHHKGVTVEWETTVKEVSQNDKQVSTEIQRPDGTVATVNSTWLIACDGAHSTVREQMHILFVGGDYPQNFWLADLHIDWDIPENNMVIYLSPDGPMACFPMGDTRYRLVMTAPHKSVEIPNFDDLVHVFKTRCPAQATLSKPKWMTPFYIHHRLIQQYRDERIFFAGDAAHIHSPFGGQGLNTGLQDIYNLAWKLALVQKGQAHTSLLDTYHLERHPVGKAVLQSTDKMTRLMLMKKSWLVTWRNKALAWLLSFKWVQQKVARHLSELDVQYKNSPIVRHIGGAKSFKAGCYLATMTLFRKNDTHGVPLLDLVKGTSHHLFLFQGLDTQKPIKYLETIALTVLKHFPGLIIPHIVVADRDTSIADSCDVLFDNDQNVHNKHGIYQSCALLLRPDNYIGMSLMPADSKGIIGYCASYLISQR